MKGLAALLLLSLALTSSAISQRATQQVFVSDIDRFWLAYDRMRTTTDSVQQLRYLHQFYIEPGTAGLRAFMQAKGYTAEQWVYAIRRYPKFWDSIRPNTLLAKKGARGMAPYLRKFRRLYPALRPAGMYFTIGALRSSGTTQDSLVLIGAELVTGTPETDISEFPPSQQAFLARYYKSLPFQNIIPLNVHEYVHTQKKGPGTTLLAQAVHEGTCDLVTELLTGKVMPLPYMTYGPQHEPELKEKFKADMFYPYYYNWFYDQVSDDPNHVPDLGYYMGYVICKAYYQRASNKPQAVKELIELDCTNDATVEAFLLKTGYYTEPLDKAQLLHAYEQSQPVVTDIAPAVATGLVDASITELRVTFSTTMASNTATEYGSGGKEQYPIVGNLGFSADKKSYTYKIALKPDHTYGFRIVGGGFRSRDGHPVKSYEVKFKTKAN